MKKIIEERNAIVPSFPPMPLANGLLSKYKPVPIKEIMNTSKGPVKIDIEVMAKNAPA